MVETSTISVKFLNFLSLQAALRSLAMVLTSRDGRVVKALDSKSNGIFPHRFESCSRRIIFDISAREKSVKKSKLSPNRNVLGPSNLITIELTHEW